MFYGTAITELKPEITFDPRLGYTVVRRWRGTPDAIDSLALSYEFLGFRCERSPGENGGYASLRVYFGAADTWPPDKPLVDKWSKKGNDLEKTLWSLPKVKTELNKVTNPNDYGKLALLKNDIEGFVRGDAKTRDDNGKNVDLTLDFIKAECASVGMDENVILGLIGAFSRGEEAFPVSQSVLVRTQIITTNSTIEADETHVDKIYTTAGMKALYPTIPLKIQNQMREGFWLKKTPTEEQIASDKIQIDYEWWFAEYYDSFIYGDPVA